MNIFFALLGILFIGLKLTGYIAWSWWFVLAPIYAPIAIALLLFAFASICLHLATKKQGG